MQDSHFICKKIFFKPIVPISPSKTNQDKFFGSSNFSSTIHNIYKFSKKSKETPCYYILFIINHKNSLILKKTSVWSKNFISSDNRIKEFKINRISE